MQWIEYRIYIEDDQSFSDTIETIRDLPGVIEVDYVDVGAD